MDVVMIDKHSAAKTELHPSECANAFQDRLKQIGKAILVLTPGEKPVAIEQSWRYFERVNLKRTGVPFDYCVDPKDIDRLITRMQKGMSVADFSSLFSDINVERASVTNPSDKACILDMIREIDVNDVVLLSVKDWLLSVVREGEKRAHFGIMEGSLLFDAISNLYQLFVRFISCLNFIVAESIGKP